MDSAWGDLRALRMFGECLADAKKARVSAENRFLRGGTGHNDVKAWLAPSVAYEQEFSDRLLEEYAKVVPEAVRGFFAAVPGLGSGVLPARIVAMTGNPRLAVPQRIEGTGKARGLVPDGEPYLRTLRQFWQFCGAGDPMSVPRSDVLGHSPSQEELLHGGRRTVVRPLLYVFTSYLVRQQRLPQVAESPYFTEFCRAKAGALEKRHQRTCRNRKRPPLSSDGCGTVLHPEWGEPGSPWRPGHAQAHAHRVTAKKLLGDFWRVSPV